MSAAPNFMERQVLSREFDRCSRWIKAALAHTSDSHTVGDVKDSVLMGTAQLWPSRNGCVVTSFTEFPNSKMCHIWLMGGKFEEVFNEHYHVIESWAKNHGCDQMCINGRKGWQRRLKSEGYEFASVVLTKRI